ncbi:hypothetical protein [Methylobacterium oxalidis]|uniref:Uncharacterized protein n=1 Tax=Methylobacterium oxalidis TaxID=944322 RepID=A0A512J9I2_9HYPH|nr:hypothetical protein [Methylobacterium oxalidis]GEP06620.1 hypothetical protein MOX02_46580 [Methylobacterium oxalidis]GJE35399.1 hypothetical protein LDDCCGHA_5617 [Methylobacterium oxalidis]GLS66234.1 hypothetical protein GCM10007888_46160 [Methylobacterium oxalidis]
MSHRPLFDPFQALAEARREHPSQLSQKLSQMPAKDILEQGQRLNSSFATFAAFAGGSDGSESIRGLPYKERKKDFSFNIKDIGEPTSRKTARLCESSAARRYTPAKVAEAAKRTLIHSKETAFRDTASAKISGCLLRKWHDGLAVLSPERVPCPGYSPADWATVFGNALAFLDTFGEQADALGWSTADLFGVHHTAGIIRVDCCGALVLTVGGPVRFITADEIRFRTLTYRRKPGQPQGVAIWEFGR